MADFTSKSAIVVAGRPGKEGHIWSGKQGPLGRDGVARVYRRLFLKAELTRPKAGPHALRHTFGTNYIRAVGGVRQLQAILGHQRIDTTMIYVHLAGQHVEADHALHSKARVMGLLGRCVRLTRSDQRIRANHQPLSPTRVSHWM